MEKSIQLYDNKIDFDEASEAWKSNKISIGNGIYRYVCQRRGQYNNSCTKKCLQGEDYCETHLKMINKNKIIFLFFLIGIMLIQT